jgi:hypothetical protein
MARAYLTRLREGGGKDDAFIDRQEREAISLVLVSKRVRTDHAA